MNQARVKRVVSGLGLLLVLIQIFQPERTNPAVVASKSLAAHVAVTPPVHTALMRSCGDCHSNQTVWPWYSRVAPLSWIVLDDVNQGRRHMNFDDWDVQESAQKAKERLVDVCAEIQKKGMPPFSYRLLHRDLTPKPEEVSLLCSWSQSFRATPGESQAIR